MAKKPHRQTFLDAYPSPEEFYRENIIEVLGEHVRNFQRIANEKRIPVNVLLKLSEPALNQHLLNVWKEIVYPEKRNARNIQRYYELMALTLYKQFIESTGKTDTEAFKQFIKERFSFSPDKAMAKNLEALKQGIPIKYKRVQVEIERVPVKSWKLEAFTPQAISLRKYINRLEHEITWREQAIKRIEKELETLNENRKLMKIIKEKNLLNKDVSTLSKMKPGTPLEKEAITLARKIKEEERLLHTMRTILSSQKSKLAEYKRKVQDLQVKYREKLIKQRKPFVEFQYELYKARKKISPLTTLHPFRRKR